MGSGTSLWFSLGPSGFNSPEPPGEVSWDQKSSDSRCSPDVECGGLGLLCTELASEAEAEASRAEPRGVAGSNPFIYLGSSGKKGILPSWEGSGGELRLIWVLHDGGI